MSSCGCSRDVGERVAQVRFAAAEDGPLINAAGLQTSAIIASISTERFTDEG